MNSLRLLLLLSFLLIMIALFQTGFLQNQKNTPNKKSVFQEKTEVLPTSPVPSPTSSPSPLPKQSGPSFLYPGANRVEEINNSEIYSTTDTPEKVTNWYKNKIVSEGYNTKTFIRTKANEKVEDVLVGSSNNKQIRIEILKKDKNSPTIITVVR